MKEKKRGGRKKKKERFSRFGWGLSHFEEDFLQI